MFSVKFNKTYNEFCKKYFNDDIVIPKRKLRDLKPSNNNIAIIPLDHGYEWYNKYLSWQITSTGVKFDRVYIFIPNMDKEHTPEVNNFLKLCDLFSDIIILHQYDNFDAEVYDIVKQHKADDIYILSIGVVYNNLNVPITGDKIVYNLHKDVQYTKRHSYFNSCLQYNVRDNTDYYKNTIVTEPDIKNMLTIDCYIPANVIDDSFEFHKNISFTSNLYYYLFMHDIKIYNLTQNIANIPVNIDVIDKELLTLITSETNQENINKWYKEYPDYKTSQILVNSLTNTIDLAFTSIIGCELIIENINKFLKYLNIKINKIYILDNIAAERYENHFWNHMGDIKSNIKYEFISNTMDEKFKKIVPQRKDLENGEFGWPLFDQSINYLTTISDADYLILCNEKILLNKPINFDFDSVWCGNSNEKNIERYLNIFNLKQMRAEGIFYNNFKQFMTEITACNLKTHNIDISQEMTLPENFDKYASSVFRLAGTRNQLIYNYFLDTYNYILGIYEGYNTRFN